jgi:hypothetical protein
LLKVFYIFDLTGLSNPIAILFKPSISIKLHYLSVILEYSHEQKKTAYNGTSSSLSMVAMKHCNSLLISSKESRYLITDGKEHVEWWSFVVLPSVADHIFENLLVDGAATHVDGNILALMLSF